MKLTISPGALLPPLRRWYERRQAHRMLGRLDAHALKDIGLVRMGNDYLSCSPRSSDSDWL
jgi:uncharacterized protein YjiS (DUF1127 family)